MGTGDPVAYYLQSIPARLLPQPDTGRSKGVVRRLNNFLRRLAIDRGTRFSDEKERLEWAAAASGTSCRTFSTNELHFLTAASSSSSMAQPNRPNREIDYSQQGGKSKGKGKTAGKQGNRGKKAGKNKHDHKHGHNADKDSHLPHNSPARETKHKKNDKVDNKHEKVEEGQQQVKREDGEEEGSPEPSPTTSPLPMSTIPAGASRSPPTGTPLPIQYSGGTFPKGALAFVSGTALCCISAPPEFHHLYRARIVGPGRQPPSTEGRRILPPRVRGEVQVSSSIGNIDVPAMPKFGYKLCQHKGWPIGCNTLERMCAISRKMGEFLRHREHPVIYPTVCSPVGELSIALAIPVADLMDAAMFSWHGRHGWRYSLDFDKVEPLEDGTWPAEPHTVSYDGWRATVRANRKHSIEILTTEGAVGGGGESKGKGKSNEDQQP
jgi:hypothetical protein